MAALLLLSLLEADMRLDLKIIKTTEAELVFREMVQRHRLDLIYFEDHFQVR